jgi:hypothetical protein
MPSPSFVQPWSRSTVPSPRERLVGRARLAGVLAIGISTTPTVLSGDVVGSIIVLIAGFSTFYAGAYMGAVGLTNIISHE